MPYTVVLDTCVLYPAHLRDTLLRLAEREFYVPKWTDHILDELRSALIRKGAATPDAADHVIRQMNKSFENAMIREYEPLIDLMTNHPRDRHVLAAAVRADAGAIVTANTRDFPDESLPTSSIDIIHPDEFLLDNLDLAPQLVYAELREQAQSNTRAPCSLPEILNALTIAGAPKFVAEIQNRFTTDQ